MAPADTVCFAQAADLLRDQCAELGIAANDCACGSLLRHSDRVIPGFPIVHFGDETRRAGILMLATNVTSLLEERKISETLATALVISPDKRVRASGARETFKLL